MSRLSTRALPLAAAIALLLLFGASAGAEQVGKDGVVVSLDGSISPRHIPRDHAVPVSVTLAGGIRSSDGTPPPRLNEIEIAFGARGGLDTTGLPRCPRSYLRNTSSKQAMARCGDALVGSGSILTEVLLNPANPLRARAGLLAFNGVANGRPAVWVHAYSASPPVSFVLPFFLKKLSSGEYGILMRAPVAASLGRLLRLSSFQITLGRRYRVAGERRSYLSASCPLPPNFSIGIFPLARATYHFAPGPNLTTTILRGCRVRR